MAAYLIVQGDVHDVEAYKKYTDRSPTVVRKFGGNFIARTTEAQLLEGERAPGRVVVIEFPDKAAVEAFYHSPEYKELRDYRSPFASLQFIAVEGCA